MTKSNSNFTTATARVRGIGPARSGFHHWWIERVLAVALVPLTLWLVWSVIQILPADRAIVAAWLTSPVNAIALSLFMVLGSWHGAFGLQVIYEDYVHCPAMKMIAILGTKFAFSILAIMSVVAIVKLHFGTV